MVEVFKIEDRGNGHRLVTSPMFPGFIGWLKPGEICVTDELIHDLVAMAVLNERERCARVAEGYKDRVIPPGGQLTGRVALCYREIAASIRHLESL